ncbi:MAG: SpoIIE family protein phosphatase [Pseudomonadota bacterium]
MAHTLRHAASSAEQKVLVVDDSAAQRMLTAGHLKKWGFDVSLASDGQEALAALRQHSFDIVISDWMMPIMDGIDLCRRFRSDDQDIYTYFILVTSKSEKAEIAEGLEAGADDFLTKPFHADELRARLHAGLRIVAMDQEIKSKTREVTQAYDDLKVIHAEISRDLKEAGDLQQSLLPERQTRFANGGMSFFLESCGHVGGDLVGRYWVSDKRAVVYSIDVSGHGISSALLTARLAAQLNASDRRQHVGFKQLSDGCFAPRAPAEIATVLNERMLGELDTEHYFTMALIDIDVTTREGAFVQAGHPAPLVLNSNGPSRLVGEGGPPVGLIDGMVFEDCPISLAPASAFLMYSDGLVEAENPNGDQFGEEALLKAASCCSPLDREVIDDLIWEVKAFAKGRALADDISAAMLSFDP